MKPWGNISWRQGLICLFPFQKHVFANQYNWEAKLGMTYPLLSILWWRDISGEVVFHSLHSRAKGILGLERSYEKELIEYCEWKKIDFPDAGANRFPTIIPTPLIRYFKLAELTEIAAKIQQVSWTWSNTTSFFPHQNTSKYDIITNLRNIYYNYILTLFRFTANIVNYRL